MAKNQTTKEEDREMWKEKRRVRMSGNFQAITKKLNENKNIVKYYIYAFLPFQMNGEGQRKFLVHKRKPIWSY